MEFMVDVAVQLLLGLKHIHYCGVLHRDLRTDNALIASLTPLQIKWADYGSAVLLTKDSKGDGAWPKDELGGDERARFGCDRVCCWFLHGIVCATGFRLLPSLL